MSKQRVTPWFPASTNPVRPGRYEVRHRPEAAPHHNSRFHLTGRFRTFDGFVWRAGWTGESISIFGTHPSHEWRGLATTPKDRHDQ